MLLFIFPVHNSRRERAIVIICTVVMHGLLAWWVMSHAGKDEKDGNNGVQGGDALVVEFIAVDAKASKRPPNSTISAASSTLVTQSETRGKAATSSAATSLSDTHSYSYTGQYVPPDAEKKTAAQSSSESTSASHSAANGGGRGDDLLARYQAAVRARIAATWRTLTERDFPSGCALVLTQTPGGSVTATSAKSCTFSQEDRLQLEAAALMAQPLPYAGYESVFAPEMQLAL